MFVEFWTYLKTFSFAQSSTLALLLASSLLGILSPILVIKQRTALADTLAHSFLPAFVVANFFREESHELFWLILLIGALIITFLSLISIEKLERLFNTPAESAIVTVMTFFFSLGLIFMSILKRKTALQHILLGNPLSAHFFDCVLLGLLLTIVSLTLYCQRNSWINWLLDEPYALIQGYPVKRIRLLFLAILSVTLMSCLMIFGSLLILALLVIPSNLVEKRSLLDLRVVIWNIFFALSGLILSYSFDLPISPTIAFVASSIFCLFFLTKSFRKKF